MLKQDFSVNALLKVTTLNEILKFNLGRDNKDYKLALSSVSEYLINSDSVVDGLSCINQSGKVIYSTNSINLHYALRKISKDLVRLYRIELASRDDIAEQIYRIFETTSQYSIIRLDVKSFYENIKYSEVFKKINREKLLSSKSIKVLKELEGYLDEGLPRGLSISPVMSEIFMKYVDEKIRNINGVYYYARYVDDIIVVSFKEAGSVFDSILSVLNGSGLSINNKKFVKNIDVASKVKVNKLYSFDYLGYKFKINTKIFFNKRVISAELSDDKVRKIKTRIIHALLDRVYNNSHIDKSELLLKRLKILSSNYPINFISSDQKLKAGIFYSHRLVSKSGIFNEFNVFLRNSLFCRKKNFFGKAMLRIPHSEKTDIINKICFVKGFESKIFIEESKVEMSRIKQCWRNKKHRGSK